MNTDITLDKFIHDIKHDLLQAIVEDLKSEKMTIGEAKYLAKDFLTLLPAKSKEDVLNKLHSLTKIYKEAQKVFSTYIGPFEEEKTQKKLAILRKYMKQGDYNYAYEAMKGGNYLWQIQ